MDLPPIIPLFIASGIFGALGAVQLALWATLTSHTGGGTRWVMLASAVAYSFIGGVFYVGGRRQRERNHRAISGRCVQCGYRLTGNVSGVCPECGRPVQR